MRSKKAIYNVLSSLLLQLVAIIYGFIVPKVIIAKYGSNVNGLISSITQFLAYITLLESGFGPVIKSILYKPISTKDNKTIENILAASERFFKKIAILFLVYILLLCFIYPTLINHEFDLIYSISLIIIIAISTFAEYYFGMTYKLYLQADQKTYIISIIQVLTYILTMIAVVIMAKFNVSIQVIKLMTTLIFVLRPILQNIYVKKKYNINIKNASKEFKIQQKWDGMVQHIAAVVHENTDITILTIFTTLAEVSVYSVYYLVVNGIKKIIQSFTNGIDAGFGDMIAKNEIDNLNKKFNIYEVLYFSITVIVFSCSMLLIVPFVSIYTKGITDVNYVRQMFGYLIVVSEFIWAIRLPYSSITLAAGHFKQTRNGALIEAILNIIISLILVIKFGIVGVTIGTIVAMTVRTIEFVYHTNKYILNRNVFASVKKIILVVIECILIVIISKYLPYLSYSNYFNWSINALILFVVSCIVTLLFNIIFNKDVMLKITNKFIRRNE